MNKKEFLDKLSRRLNGLPKDDIDDRVSFYEEMINDRIDEGKTEDEAINEIGNIDDIVNQIVSETPLTKIIKEKTKPRKKKSGLQLLFLILGFPLWFPLFIVGLILIFVLYLLVWILVIVTYSIELSLVFGGIGSIIGFVIYSLSGNNEIAYLGLGLGCIGIAIFFIFPCLGSTKITLKLTKKIMHKIKMSFLRKGEN